MKDKRRKAGDSIDFILENLLESQSSYQENKASVHKAIEIYASPDEGVRLIRAFIQIKQTVFRAALIELATRMVDHKD